MISPLQSNDLASVRLLLAFGADVNLVNSRHHTPLDVATFSWLAHERQAKVMSSTSTLGPAPARHQQININICPDVSSSPVPSPLLQRPRRQPLTRLASNTSWVYVDPSNGHSPSHSPSPGMEDSGERLQASSEDSRGFLCNVMPMRAADLKEEVPETVASQGGDALEAVAAILNVLYSVDAQSGKSVKSTFKNQLPVISSLSESSEFREKVETGWKMNPFRHDEDFDRSVKLRDFVEGRTVLTLYEELEHNIDLRLQSQSSLTTNPDEAIAIAAQQWEMRQFKTTLKDGIGFEVNGGSRLLFLDGGGIKGLVQLEVMRQLEEVTGRKIIELFDWIIGSSIGGILALGLVYGMCTIIL